MGPKSRWRQTAFTVLPLLPIFSNFALFYKLVQLKIQHLLASKEKKSFLGAQSL